MDNQKLLETIVSHLVDLKQDVSGLKQDVSSLKQDFTGLKEDVSGLKQDVTGLKQDVTGLKEDVSGLKQDVAELKGRVSNLEGSVAKIENDHGAKLAALLDGYHQNAKILDDHTDRLSRIETKITTHDIQISILDKTKSNRRSDK